MKRKVPLIFALALLPIALQPAQAIDEKVIAVIDTSIDSSKNSSITYEVCINSEYSTCGGAKFKEGRGVANVPDWKIKGIDHGFNIVQVINNVSPNTKIVFIRISEVTPSNTLRLDARSVATALTWVSKNASTYGIDAVNISQSSVGRTYTADICTKDPILEAAALSLKTTNIPTFVAVGNDGDKTKIGFPACAKNVIPVASVDPTGKISSFSNFSTQVQVVANDCAKYIGNICAKSPDYAGVMRANSGTSIASPLAVSTLINKWTGESWDSLIASLPRLGNVARVQ